MEDNLNFWKNGIQPQFLEEWKNGRQPHFFGKWKMTSIFWVTGRQPIFLGQWKTTNFFGKVEEDDHIYSKMDGALNLFVIGKQP